MGTSHASVLIECPGCKRERLVSARTARRGAGRCRWCLSKPLDLGPPDDEDRRYWLERFSDEELAEIVWFTFGHRPDRAHICSERERLLGRVVVPEGTQARQPLRRPPEDSRAPSVLPVCGPTLRLSRLT